MASPVKIGTGLAALYAAFQPEEAEASIIGQTAKGTKELFDFAKSAKKAGKSVNDIWEESWEKFGAGAFWDDIDQTWKAEVSNADDIFNEKIFEIGSEKASDLFDTPLYEYYPQLKNLAVDRPNMGNNAMGKFSNKDFEVLVNDKLGPDTARDVFTHEFQHAIQSLEPSFSKGGSPSKMGDDFKSDAYQALLRMEVPDFNRIKLGPDADVSDYKRRLNNALEKFDDVSPEERYELLSGEVEARIAEDFRKYDKDELVYLLPPNKRYTDADMFDHGDVIPDKLLRSTSGPKFDAKKYVKGKGLKDISKLGESVNPYGSFGTGILAGASKGTIDTLAMMMQGLGWARDIGRQNDNGYDNHYKTSAKTLQDISDRIGRFQEDNDVNKAGSFIGGFFGL